VNKKTTTPTTTDAREKVAREAATLLYFGSEKEYKQAKLKAAANLGVHVLPSNLEIALELDRVSQETEGSARTERLIKMRTEALRIMKVLAPYCPILIGSVWRGTIRRGSDIDVEAYYDEPDEVVAVLKAEGLKIQKTERMTTTEHGKTVTSLHIHGESESKNPVEIVVRTREEAGRKRKCDTFGDEIKGLTAQQLEKVLKVNPPQQFLPK
jgi:predicted nucleotidyltransferase